MEAKQELYADEPILIRYDGLDADRHEIELGALADSLKGIARIIGVTGNFAATGRFVQHRDAMDVRVLARPPEAHCFELWAWITWGAQHPLWSAIGAGLTVSLVQYTFSKLAGRKEEMKHLRGALEAAITQLGTRDQGQIDRLLSTIDKMVDALRPAARQAVSPIGNTASTLTVGSAHSGSRTTLGAVDRDAIVAKEDAEVSPEATYHVRLIELNTATGSCKVVIEGDDDRQYPGTITDPVFALANNVYAMALAGHQILDVRAKALIKEGEIERLYISNTVS